MRNIIISLILIILISSFISAEIIFSQTEEIYNFGDTFSTSATVKATEDIEDIFNTYLVCEGIEKEVVPKQYIELQTTEEEIVDIRLKLTELIIGNQKGECKIKIVFGNENVLSNSFIISNLININLSMNKIDFKPEETISIEGVAIKENREAVEGFVELNISEQDIQIKETVNEGRFLIEFQFPKDTSAGQYLVELNVYEKDKNGNSINKGFVNKNIAIIQVPTSLEVVFENPEVEPGTNLKVKGILHDQTGEKIESEINIIIENKYDEIVEQVEKPTDEFLEFPIGYNNPPEEWNVIINSDELNNEASFEIKEKENVRVEIINKTVIITNTGNVFYNKTVLVKIGNESINIETNLGLDEIQKYILGAPDGEYQVEIITDGESQISKNIILTGNAIDVKEISKGVVTLVRHPLVWIFIIVILGFIAFMIFKKGYKRSFFGHIGSKKEEKTKDTPIITKKNSIINPRNKAELSLSLKGEKQNVDIISLKIKNFKDIKFKEESISKTLQKIIDLTEEKNSFTYENHDNLFFILAPMITKTFKNERVAINIAQKIIEILKNHNKLFKQKIEFGISLNYGEIIAKKQGDLLSFMSMGTLITNAKKIAAISNGEVLLSKKMKEKTMSDIRTEKKEINGTEVYTIKEIRNRDNNKKFISDFIHRLEGKKK
tara:strand:- start:5032 stop:7026 length:1995 start_codon:yes stop_codon:yes gene_type:complete